MPAQITADFELERATKNTYRYIEVEVPPAVRILYIRKSAFTGVSPPERITVSINWEEK